MVNVCKWMEFPGVLALRFALGFLVIATVIELDLLLPGSSVMASGQKNPYQGVYVGTQRYKDMGNGTMYDCTSRLTVMPDGHSIIISTQLPNSSISNEVVEGSFNGNMFVGASRGRLNGIQYIYGYNYWIRFVGNQARMTGKPVNPEVPGGGPADWIFYRIRS
jgi:hypothetical protein